MSLIRELIVDANGCAYVTGETRSNNYPVTSGAYDTTYNGEGDTFITKLSQDGSSLVYSTFLGGSDRDDGWGISLGSNGLAYVTGGTDSSDFPTTMGAFNTSYDGSNYCAFVSKLNADGSALEYSTFLGRDSTITRDITIDNAGSAYVTGWTSDYPTTNGAYDTTMGGTYDVFVTKLNSDGSSLLYSTFLGGSEGEDANAIDVDSNGCAYVTGHTWSNDFPTTIETFSTGPISEPKVFITKLSPDGESIDYSAILSGSDYQTSTGIAVDNEGCAHITGYTSSTDFPITEGAYDTTFNSGSDCFVVKLNTDGTELVFSTFLGGGESSSNSMLAPAVLVIAVICIVTGLIWIKKRKQFPPNREG